jgi:uncharacterized protein YegL
MHSDHVLPIYVVCDQSFSMMDHIDALNDSLLELYRAVGADPVAAERIRVCLIGFSESPKILLPLCRLSENTRISGLSGRAATNFGATFIFLRETIATDVEHLRSQSHQVCRPIVVFLSDGQPTDPAAWPAAHARLTDPSWPARPEVIAFGLGDADPVTIGRIGTSRAFLGRDGISLAATLSEQVSGFTTPLADRVQAG